LTAGDLDVRSSFALSYRGLPEPTRRAFRLLSLIDAADVAAWLLAAMLDVAEPAADGALADLAEAQLLDVVGHDAVGQRRYRMHDLLRLYAGERLTAEEPPPQRAAAVQPYWQGRAHASRGRLYARTGQAEQAAESYADALHLLEPLGAPETTGVANRLREATTTPPTDPTIHRTT